MQFVSQLYGYHFNLAIKQTVGNDLYLPQYDILFTLHLYGSLAPSAIYTLLRSHVRFSQYGFVAKNVSLLLAGGYVYQVGTKYHVTDKSLLLIAKVERKLQAILKEKGLIEVKPVGRPNRGGNMKEL